MTAGLAAPRNAPTASLPVHGGSSGFGGVVTGSLIVGRPDAKALAAFRPKFDCTFVRTALDPSLRKSYPVTSADVGALTPFTATYRSICLPMSAGVSTRRDTESCGRSRSWPSHGTLVNAP